MFMLTFDNLEKLKNYLQIDKEKISLSPARLINVNSISVWQDMKNFLTSLSKKVIFLSDFCIDEDTMPNLGKLYSRLKSERQSVCVLPMSEYLLLQPETAADEVNKILNLQTQEGKKYRLYFLMYRMQTVFQSMQIKDPRKKDCIISLNTTSRDNYSLTVIQKNMPVNLKSIRTEGFKNYLRYWEETPEKSLCLFTDNAIFFQDKHFFDDVKIIVTAFDLLRYYYDLPQEIEKDFGKNEQWKKLANLAAEAGSFNQALCKKFSTKDFHIKLFGNWSEQDNFSQWLLWLWCRVQKLNLYCVNCAKKSTSPEDFAEKIFWSVFNCVDYKNFDEIYNERKEILSLMKISVPVNFWDRLSRSDKENALKILTDNSTQEKILIFQTLQRFKFSERDKVINVLKKIYPDLSDYLSTSLNLMTAEQEDYFSQYRFLKVTDNLTAEFAAKVQKVAAQKGKDIYLFKSRDQIVENEYSDSAAIYFVDAMGAEYLNYFFANFSALDEKISVRYQVGYCDLPSITKINKGFLQGKNIAAEILEFDKIKHSTLNYPENIVAELNFLSMLKEKILTVLEKYRKIILTSDHGTSRLAIIARKNNFDKTFAADGRNIFNCGRFADALPDDENNFSSAIYDGGKIIFADYSRFLQTGSPGNEIHGGATLEEWLVPVITIKKIGKTEKISKPKMPKKIPEKKKVGIEKNKDFDI